MTITILRRNTYPEVAVEAGPFAKRVGGVAMPTRPLAEDPTITNLRLRGQDLLVKVGGADLEQNRLPLTPKILKKSIGKCFPSKMMGKDFSLNETNANFHGTNISFYKCGTEKKSFNTFSAFLHSPFFFFLSFLRK